MVFILSGVELGGLIWKGLVSKINEEKNIEEITLITIVLIIFLKKSMFIVLNISKLRKFRNNQSLKWDASFNSKNFKHSTGDRDSSQGSLYLLSRSSF